MESAMRYIFKKIDVIDRSMFKQMQFNKNVVLAVGVLAAYAIYNSRRISVLQSEVRKLRSK